MGAGLGQSTCLITDGRFSGASRGFIIGELLTTILTSGSLCRVKIHSCGCVGHVVPEAQLGGPIALVKDGDQIIVDAKNLTIDWLVDERTKAERKKEWGESTSANVDSRSGYISGRHGRSVR